MFEGIKYSLISRMMLPSLEPMDVAKKIAASIEEGSNREIYTPPLTYLLFVAICLPTNVRDWLQKVRKRSRGSFKSDSSCLKLTKPWKTWSMLQIKRIKTSY